MDIATARTIVRTQARSAGSSVLYADAQIDVSIKTIMDEFLRLTKASKTVSTISLTAADAGILPTLPTNFRPDRIISVYLTGSNVVTGIGGWGYGGWYGPWYTEGAPAYNYNGLSASLSVISYQQLLEMKYSGTVTGQPQFIAFSGGVVSGTTGEVFPAPDQTYTANILWYQPFNDWTEGQAFATAVLTGTSLTSITVSGGGSIYVGAPTVTFSAGNGAATAMVSNGAVTGFTGVSGTGYVTAPGVLLNGVAATVQTLILPDDYNRTILSLGVASYLQQTEEQNSYAIKQQARYDAWVKSIVNAGSLGAREVISLGRGR